MVCVYKGILDKQAPSRDPRSQVSAVLQVTRGLVRTTRFCHWAKRGDCCWVRGVQDVPNLLKAAIKFGGFCWHLGPKPGVCHLVTVLFTL